MSGDMGNLGTAHLLQVNATRTNTAQHVSPVVADSSPSVGDYIFDGTIAFFFIVMIAFFAIGFMEKGRE